MATFGQLISTRRKELGLSQKQLACRIVKEDGEAISPQYLNDLERDRRNSPSEHLVRQFAAALTISEDHLCLAAGTMPSDIQEEHSGAPTKIVDKAFRAFRRELKGK